MKLGDWRWAFLVNLPVGVGALVRSPRLAGREPGAGPAQAARPARCAAARGRDGAAHHGDRQGQRLGLDQRRASLVRRRRGRAAALASSRARGVHPLPLLDPALFRSAPFVVANAVTVVAGIGFYAYLLTNVLWLQYVWD